MSAPIIWIIFPGFFSVFLFIIRKYEWPVTFLGASVSLLLSWTAWQIPIDRPVAFGETVFKIAESQSIYGRELILRDVDRPFLVLFYLLQFVWILGVIYAKPGWLFVPFSFAIEALLIAALAVEPFLYAALLIQVVILLFIPLISPPDKKPGRGVFRFLSLQSLGMPFILFTGWILTGLETGTGAIELVYQAGMLLGIGFVFLLAVFPFHTWLPMVGGESHPFVAAYLFFILPGMVSMFGIGFLDQYAWLRGSEAVIPLLLFLGMMMGLVAGIWGAFERHQGRLLGFAAMMEIGLNLLAIGLDSSQGVMLYFGLIIPRVAAYMLWSIGLSRLKERQGSLELEDLRGMGYYRPFLSLLILISQFTLAGLPLLAGFPLKISLWQALAQDYPLIMVGSVLGHMGMLIAALRTLFMLFAFSEYDQKPDLTLYFSRADLPEQTFRVWLRMGLFVSVVVAIVGLGVFPHAVYDRMGFLLQSFEHFGH